MVLLFIVLSGCAAAQPLKDNFYYMERYYSVSYPLHQMKVSSDYGWRNDPFTKQRAFHEGIDFACTSSAVLAMFDGVIKETGDGTRPGKYLVLQCGSYDISYCHLSKILKQRGDSVSSGDTIAITGNSGRSTGPHLHLSVRHKGELINPSKLLKYVRYIRKECFEALGPIIDSVLPPKQFIARYAPLAVKYSNKYGIPASVILSQMAYESAWGKSKLSRRGNNYFGIKATKAWIKSGKPYSLHDDDQAKEPFCNYPSIEASMNHYAETVTGKHYSQCKNYSSTDYVHWLIALQRKGYATNPSYAKDCIQIIRKHHLYKYDT